MKSAYLAGIIDGEGSIMLPRTGQNKVGGMYASFTLKLSIANTDLGLLSAICSSYGGMIREKKPPSERCKKSYTIIWFGPDAKRVLDIVYTDLIVKRRVADLAREYFLFKADNPPSRGDGIKPRGRGRSIAQVVELNRIASDIKSVNKRGVE